MSALEKLGEAARRARAYISPWNVISPTDVASNLPGGGIASAAPFYGEGLKKTAEATKAFREGRFGDAARFYGSGVLDTATAGLSAAGDVAPLAKLAMTMVPAAKKTVGIRAFHGSPHDFDRFDMSKIGTGEGAQAYGHGLYFAENEGVAKNYREFLSSRANDLTDPGNLAASTVAHYGGVEEGKQSLRGLIKQIDKFPAAYKHNPGAREQAQKALEFLESGAELPLQGGRMYEVRINADPEQFLDWDKPLSEQSEAVRKALGGAGGRSYSDQEFKAAFGNILAGTPYEGMSARNVLEPLLASGKDSAEFVNLVRQTHPEAADRLQQAISAYGSPTGAQAYKALGHTSRSTTDIVPSFDRGVEASQALREAGIPGIKYLDAGSRGAGDGTRNYVVFDDKLVEIIRKYGWAPGMAIPAAMALEMQQAQEQSAPQM